MPLQVIDHAVIPASTMKEEPEPAYIDGIQTPSNPVRRPPSILNLKGLSYFQKRIPRDLVRAKCYGKTEIIKRAWRTGDLAEARQGKSRSFLALLPQILPGNGVVGAEGFGGGSEWAIAGGATVGRGSGGFGEKW